jgi:hypothetical protein
LYVFTSLQSGYIQKSGLRGVKMSNVLKGVKFDSNIDWYRNNPRFSVVDSTKFVNVGVLPKQAVITDKVNVLSKSIRHMPYFKIAGYIDGISDGDDYIKLDDVNHIYFNAMYEFSNEEIKSLVDSDFYYNDVSTIPDFFNDATRLIVPLKMNFANVYEDDIYKFTYVGLDPSNYKSGHIILDMNSLGQSLVQYMAVEMAEHKIVTVDRGKFKANELNDELINANNDLKLLLESVSNMSTDVSAVAEQQSDDDIASLLSIFNEKESTEDKDVKEVIPDTTDVDTKSVVTDNDNSGTLASDDKSDVKDEPKAEISEPVNSDIDTLLGLMQDSESAESKKDKTDPPQDAYLYDKDKAIGKDVSDFDKAILDIYQNIFEDHDISGTFADDKARELS